MASDAPALPYIGSMITLISNMEVRYQVRTCQSACNLLVVSGALHGAPFPALCRLGVFVASSLGFLKPSAFLFRQGFCSIMLRQGTLCEINPVAATVKLQNGTRSIPCSLFFYGCAVHYQTVPRIIHIQHPTHKHNTHSHSAVKITPPSILGEYIPFLPFCPSRVIISAFLWFGGPQASQPAHSGLQRYL